MTQRRSETVGVPKGKVEPNENAFVTSESF